MEALTISYAELALGLPVSVVLCSLVGFEREVRHQPAGFRTHILLGLGATLFTLVSAYGFEPFTQAAAGRTGVTFDPTSIAAQIVTGVGFLGAGAIIRQGGDVRGLTTAASLWTVASIGTAAGAGYLFAATAATAVVLAPSSPCGGSAPTSSNAFGRTPRPSPSPSKNRPPTPPRRSRSWRTTASASAPWRRSWTTGTPPTVCQVRIHPPQDVHGALSAVTALPEVEKVTVSGLRGPE